VPSSFLRDLGYYAPNACTSGVIPLAYASNAWPAEGRGSTHPKIGPAEPIPGYGGGGKEGWVIYIRKFTALMFQY